MEKFKLPRKIKKVFFWYANQNIYGFSRNAKSYAEFKRRNLIDRGRKVIKCVYDYPVPGKSYPPMWNASTAKYQPSHPKTIEFNNSVTAPAE